MEISLYDVSVISVMGSSVSFTTNGIVPIANVTSTLIVLVPLLGCMDQSALTLI